MDKYCEALNIFRELMDESFISDNTRELYIEVLRSLNNDFDNNFDNNKE